MVVEESILKCNHNSSPDDFEGVLTTSVEWSSKDQAGVAAASVSSAREKLARLLQERQEQERPAKCRSQTSQAMAQAAQERAKTAEARALEAERSKTNAELAAAEASCKAASAEAAAVEAAQDREMALQRAQLAEATVAALELEIELNQAEADTAHEEMQFKQDGLQEKLRLAEAGQLEAELWMIAIEQERDRFQARLLRLKRRLACSTMLTWSVAAVFGGVLTMVASRLKCLTLSL